MTYEPKIYEVDGTDIRVEMYKTRSDDLQPLGGPRINVHFPGNDPTIRIGPQGATDVDHKVIAEDLYILQDQIKRASRSGKLTRGRLGEILDAAILETSTTAPNDPVEFVPGYQLEKVTAGAYSDPDDGSW